VPAPRPRRISDIMPKLQNVSLTTNYFVKFSLPPTGLRSHLRRKGINDRFISDDVGLLCSGAVLPGSALASQNITGDYQGMVERFAHTRNFTQVQFEFYVDNEYKSLKFIEHWMEYVTGANQVDPGNDTYYFQLNYPSDYKSNDTRIVKFERDHFRFLEYRFIGLFPLSLNSTRVQYGNSQILKATASFSFDRYISGESSSLLRDLRRAYNDLGFGRGNVVKDGLSLKDDELNEIAERTTLRYLNNADNIRKGSYTSLSQNGSSSYQSNVTLLGTSSPGINP
tara:strand:+ start:3045 stop:3890 length:846 start_codon:yes stop_codon:yes gene_type:complete